jgi:hypothetical protein
MSAYVVAATHGASGGSLQIQSLGSGEMPGSAASQSAETVEPLARYARALRPATGLTGVVLLGMAWAMVGNVSASSQHQFSAPVRMPPWPCRLVVKPTLLGVVEEGWERSPTLRRQCRELADASSVVVLEWRQPRDSQSRASTRMGTDSAGVVVAMVYVPPVGAAIELVAHELEHVLERTRGQDLAAEARRRDSGVWKAIDGFESQRAIDIGRQVAREVEESRRARKPPNRTSVVTVHPRSRH